MRNVIALIYILNTVRASVRTEGIHENMQNYSGAKFPEKYLEAEDVVPTRIDLYKYMAALDKVLTYFNSDANDTCYNKVIGSFLAQATLIRTLKDDGESLEKPQLEILKSLISKTDFYLSHFQYIYIRKNNEIRGELYDTLRTLAHIAKGSEVLGFSLPKFSRNQLKKWIRIDHNINSFLEAMDSAVLPKEKYAELVAISSSDGYHISTAESDSCLLKLNHNYLPSKKSEELKPCEPDFRCMKALHSEPSIGYGLSHRMLNIFLYRYQRQCYWRSPCADLWHLNVLCAFMYREAVYVARRGFFARDIFMEHVALCGMMGYEEFYRRHWFYHVMRWMDDEGCLKENTNFWRNRSRFEFSKIADDNKKTKLKMKVHSKAALRTNCDNHLMAVLTPYLANAIRHAAHFMNN